MLSFASLTVTTTTAVAVFVPSLALTCRVWVEEASLSSGDAREISPLAESIKKRVCGDTKS